MIDHLPVNTVTQEAIANDEELAEALVAARGTDLPTPDKKPALRAWTQEAALLAQLITDVRGLRAVLIAVNSKEGAPQPKVDQIEVPETAYQRVLARAREEQRLRKHSSLVRKLLGDRAKR